MFCSRKYPQVFLSHLAMLVLDTDTGDYLNYRHLLCHPRLSKIWMPSASNELGRLCQGIGVGPDGTGKRIDGTDTFFAIQYDDIPKDRRKEVTYTSVVCEVRPQKEDPN